MGRGAKAAGCAGIALLLVTSLVPLPAAAKDTAPEALITQINVENRTTDAWGGGNELVVKVGNNVFGVVYGGQGEGAGYVTFYGAVVRTLGTADVYERVSGRLVREDVPLPVVSVVAQRMLGIVEFRDVAPRDGFGPGDGIFNYRPNLSTPEILDFNASEPMLKALELRGNWSLHDFALRAEGEEAVILSYTLTLSDVPYTHPGPDDWAGDGLVDAVSFHVKMVLTRSVETVVEIPHYNATVGRTRDGRQLSSLSPAGTTEHTVTVTRASLKIDHEIVGWDPAPVVRDAPPRLLLITGIPVLQGTSALLAPWISEIALHGERTTTAQVDVPDGEPVRINEDTRPVDTFARADGVELRDGWRRTGAIGFDPTVQVWGPQSHEPDTGRAYFQVLGGAPVSERVDHAVFRGFLLIAGFSYPAAYRVYHDPEFAVESLEFGEAATLPAFQSAFVMAAQFGAIAVSAVGALVLSAYFVSSRARARRKASRQRFEALRERYQLPPGGGQA